MSAFDSPTNCLEKSEQHVQRERTVFHPSLPDKRPEAVDENFSFVIAADCQLGMLKVNKDWNAEIESSRRAVAYINALPEKPAFVSMCGDICDMEPTMYAGRLGTKEYCVEIQHRQYIDFKDVWKNIDPSIPLVCLCGNHDVGNAPTVESINRFTSHFGDDYFAFWCKGCYCICLNTNLYNDKSNAPEQFTMQHEWLITELSRAREANARRIFLFGHHPWFLYDEEEDEKEMRGFSPFPCNGGENTGGSVPDSYFIIKRAERRKILALCQEYGVAACFAGHYHQNHVSETTFGMQMIVTGPITPVVLHSTGFDGSDDPQNVTKGPGVRIVHVNNAMKHGFTHSYEVI